MKRSSQVTLGFLATAALAFTSGCRSNERRDCVDEQNRIVGEQNCTVADQQRRSGYTGYVPFHYLYGGRTGGRVGDAVLDGNPSPGMRTGGSSGGFFGSGSSSGTSRGGFGGFFGGGGS